jgi:hypothetical protein
VAVHSYHHPRDRAEGKASEHGAVVKEKVEVDVPLDDDEAHACREGREGGREEGREG